MPELGKEYLGYELKIDGTVYLVEVTGESGSVFKVSHRVKNGAWYSDMYTRDSITYPSGSVFLCFE